MERIIECNICGGKKVDRSKWCDFTLKQMFIEKGLEVATDMKMLYQMITIMPEGFLPEKTMMWCIARRTEIIMEENKK